MKKPVVAILYEYFFPGYKAGGPIQSLVNMMQALSHLYDFKVITTAYDLKSNTPYDTIKINSWNQIKLPILNGEMDVDVWYDSKRKPSITSIKRVIIKANADIIFINGFYTNHFLFPLLLHKIGSIKNTKVIISPRGMLQAGALQIKPVQKKIYLNVLKTLGLFRSITFHATSHDEAEDIHKIFGENARIVVAGNIPKMPWPNISEKTKVEGVLQLIYLSVITPKKNLLQLINELKNCRELVNVSIYGPIKEQWYWEKCLVEIANLPTNVKVVYEGHIQTNLVQKTLSNYDAMVLLTKGENFGHALYESLSVGVPIITSFFTPWTNLEQQSAGWSIDIGKYSTRTVSQLIDMLALQNNEYWIPFRNGALQMASSYYYGQFFLEDYNELFSSLQPIA